MERVMFFVTKNSYCPCLIIFVRTPVGFNFNEEFMFL